MPIQSTTEYRNGNVKNVVSLSFGQIYTLDIHTGVHVFNLFASGVHTQPETFTNKSYNEI